MARRLVVLTGGPGAGKTTLLNALRDRGHATTTDAARALVRADPRVRDDEAAFQDAILEREIAAYDAARGTTFFDRGISDVAAAYDGREVPPHVDAAVRAHPYDAVYALPPWREIYVTDAERIQTFDHAERVYAAILATYEHYGYDVVVLPKATVEERLAYLDNGEAGRPREGTPGS